jgi:hypothetical protein
VLAQQTRGTVDSSKYLYNVGVNKLLERLERLKILELLVLFITKFNTRNIIPYGNFSAGVRHGS